MRLEGDIYGVGSDGQVLSLVPFHGFSPTLKSLRLIFFRFPSSQISDLIFSFPLLEDPLVSPPPIIRPTTTTDEFNQKHNAIERSNPRLLGYWTFVYLRRAIEETARSGWNLIASLPVSGNRTRLVLGLVRCAMTCRRTKCEKPHG